ncbi:MAG: hypothetical protein FIB07_18100 [Candidatus Methanoperedens sp.]|nr:hypothetical protein [Candidatus Methanoperedens sp.]
MMIALSILGIMMKVSEIIEEFIPCEVCGNNDLENFYFHVSVGQPYVKCCECEEEYYSTSARKILARAEESRKAKRESRITSRERTGIGFKDQKPVHPLVKTLAQM